ncbi:retrotransposable element ORF2 protein [Plecturocebus cupreus]
MEEAEAGGSQGQEIKTMLANMQESIHGQCTNKQLSSDKTLFIKLSSKLDLDNGKRFFFLTWSLTLSSRLECNGMISPYCDFHLLGSSMSHRVQHMRANRQPTEWEKIFAIYPSDKGLIFRIYKEHPESHSVTRSECSGTISAHLNLHFPGSTNTLWIGFLLPPHHSDPNPLSTDATYPVQARPWFLAVGYMDHQPFISAGRAKLQSPWGWQGVPSTGRQDPAAVSLRDGAAGRDVGHVGDQYHKGSAQDPISTHCRLLHPPLWDSSRTVHITVAQCPAGGSSRSVCGIGS